MAGKNTKYNTRTQTILNMVRSRDELDDPSRLVQDPRKKQVHSGGSNSQHTSIISRQKLLTGDNETDFINDLYSREYLTPTVFDQMCETQTSQNSFHLDNIDITTNFFPENSLLTNNVIPIEVSDTFEIDLTCIESFLPSPQCEPFILNGGNTDSIKDSQIHGTSYLTEDFDSDDSVRDKDYLPSQSDSSLSEEDIDAPSTSKRARKLVKAQKVAPTHPLQSTNIQSQTLSHKRAKSWDGSLSIELLTSDNNRSNLKEKVFQKRRNTLDTSKSPQHRSIQSQTRNRQESQDGSLSIDYVNNNSCTNTKKVSLIKRRNTLDTSRSIQDTNMQTVIRKRSNSWDGFITINVLPVRKRKKFSTSLAERKQLEMSRKRNQYRVKPGCNNKCQKKCLLVFNQTSREAVNSLFWELTWEERRYFIKNHVSVAEPKRKTTTCSVRNLKKTFRLKNVDGIFVPVCKVFFLTTLGFKKSNDKVLYNAFHKSTIDNRGKHQKTEAYDRNLLTEHVESFHPTEPHYRREHAPLRRYIPSDISITLMHDDYCKKHPDATVSYEIYRLHVKKMNISFTRLGHEECESCEEYTLHKKQTSHDVLQDLVSDCDTCVVWATHHEKYTKARELYDFHKTEEQSSSQIFYSADLEKVIMLPRLDTFKAVIFCNRLTVFNQTFAPLGKITLDSKPLTVLWHDGIAGRKQEDIMSAFYSFLIRYRDIQTVNIWLDNCSSQNKNWLLYSLLTHMVNSDLISAEKIILYYFEPGHTFMSCDQVHHQVELAMKRKSKLYDYADFVETVGTINNGKVNINSMTPQSFLNLPNNVSERRINNSKPRAYLKNMSQVCFQRNMYDLMYKNNFNDDYITLRFMNDKYLKNPSIINLTFRTEPKGVEKSRKNAIINKLSGLIPPHKMTFWKNLSTHD